MKKKMIHCNKGIALMMVTLAIFTLSILTMSMIIIAVTESRSQRKIVESITAEQRAIGEFLRYYQSRYEGTALTLTGQETLNNRTYDFTITETIGTGTFGTDQDDVQIDYN